MRTSWPGRCGRCCGGTVPTEALTAEFRLLVACSWAPPEPYRAAQAERIEELCGRGVAWDAFPALVGRHQTAALTCLALERWGVRAVPEAVLGQLRGLAARARARSLRAAAEGARIARALAAQRVEMLSLKGGPLSVELYGDPAARHAADVDIMVREGEVERTEGVLESLGYAPEVPRDRLTPRLRGMMRACSNAAAYRNASLRCAVDLHWDQELWTATQVETLWRRSEEAECLGAPVRRLDADMLLLYLCDHGAKHNWARVKWLSDVAMLLARRRERPWEELFALAGELDTAVSLGAAVLLAGEMYGLEVGEALREFAGRDRYSRVVAGESIAAMGMTEEELAGSGRRQGVGDKLRNQILRRPALPLTKHLRARLLHAEDLARFALPDSLLWMHYPLRPFFRFWRQCRPMPGSAGRGVG
jgi:hypothetical protein